MSNKGFEFFKKIDFDLLRDQKLTLLYLLDSNQLTEEQTADLDGIALLIDYLQDTAVELGIPEDKVFPE